MKISVLDAGTLGDDLDLSRLKEVGEVRVYRSSAHDVVAERIADADVVVVNKVPLGKETLYNAKRLRLICLAATGYDNVDTEYCKANGIQVSNVVGYSTDSVTQVTVSGILELATHIREYTSYVSDGSYSSSGRANKVTPVYYELAGKTWGIVGLGNIGRKVAEVARAFGCYVIACKRTPEPDIECVGLDELCRRSDIISIHTPLTSQTRGMIGTECIKLMKSNVILYNAARGAVTDERAVAEAVKSGRIGAFGCDVYSEEPFGKSHPMYEIKELPNVCLTPHMAWGSYEARNRCLNEIIENIRAFKSGVRRNAVV